MEVAAKLEASHPLASPFFKYGRIYCGNGELCQDYVDNCHRLVNSVQQCINVIPITSFSRREKHYYKITIDTNNYNYHTVVRGECKQPKMQTLYLYDDDDATSGVLL